MIIYRQKIFYEKMEYYTKFQRIKKAADYAFGTGLLGATIGSILGIFGGLKGMKRGAAIVGGLGVLGGAKLGWKMTSNEYVDQVNERNKRQEKLLKEVEKDPSIIFEDLKQDDKLIREFRVLENKYDVKFPDEFYKLIKIRKLFIPTLIDWYKKYKDPNYTSVLYSIIPSVTSSDLDVVKEYSDDHPEGSSITLLIDPEMADDTFITYNPLAEEKKFDSDIFWGEGDYTTLKEAILDTIKTNLTFEDRESQKDLLKRYQQFIISKL